MRFGFLVDEAKGGIEATAAVQIMPPRLALVDPTLSAASTFLSAIAAARIPMITMTTDFMKSSPGATDTLVKPFSLDSMLTSVRKALRSAAVPAQAPEERL